MVKNRFQRTTITIYCIVFQAGVKKKNGLNFDILENGELKFTKRATEKNPAKFVSEGTFFTLEISGYRNLTLEPVSYSPEIERFISRDFHARSYKYESFMYSARSALYQQ